MADSDIYEHARHDCRPSAVCITEHPISTSVRYNSGLPDDVQTVQQLLNAVPAMEGGPTPLLAVDGICGSKTTAAINRYQSMKLGFSDGAVDPGGPTIRSLAGFVCTSPAVPYGPVSAEPPTQAAGSAKPSPSSDKVTGIVYVNIGRALLKDMEPAINLLRWRMTRIDAVFVSFMNKHFATGKSTVDNADMGFVSRIVADIHHYVARFNAFGKSPIDNVLLFDDTANPDFIARTVRGGDKMSTSQIQIYKSKKGVVTKDPGQSIWLSRKFGDQTMDEKRLTILHEMAHFVGPRDSSFAKVDDYAPRADSANFLTIQKFLKLHCAESLALFILEWCIGTDATVAMPIMATHGGHFRQSPRVVDRRVLAQAA